MVGTCPACGSEIGLGQATGLGSRATCQSCGAYLEIISLEPLELDRAIDQPDGQLQYDYQLEENATQC
jgi:lysine biosynthesis protein LysW